MIGSPHSDDVRLGCQIFNKFQLETFIKNFQDQEVRWPALHKNSPGSLKNDEKKHTTTLRPASKFSGEPQWPPERPGELVRRLGH